MSTSKEPPNKLIVIGAGMAGIKLSHYCLKHNPNMEIQILEANDYIGGRVRKMEFSKHTVEMGANWISGMETKFQNPIWSLAKQMKLNGHFCDRNEDKRICALDGENGNDIKQEYVQSVNRFDTAYEQAISLRSQRKITSKNDVDVKSLLEECGWKELSAVDVLVQHNFLDVWICDDLAALSAGHNMTEGANDVDLGKDEFFVEDKRGFHCIMDEMVREIKDMGGVIHLNVEVDTIDYTNGNAKIKAKDVVTGSLKEFVADAVVCTVSLGVLQKNIIRFVPSLPDWKVKAINEPQMFLFSKVYVEFAPNEFWENAPNQIIILNKNKGRYPLWMKYRNCGKKSLFMCFLGGKEAERVESLSTESIKDEVEELFTKAFQKYKIDKSMISFRPVNVAVTDWSKNKRFCGSYSLYQLHAFQNIPLADLTRGISGVDSGAENEPKTVYFAGEGFDDMYNGWVQGAFRSGEHVAKSILGIDKNSEE